MRAQEISVRRGSPTDVEEAAKVLLANYNMKNFSQARAAYLRELDMKHRFVLAFDGCRAVGICSWYMHGVPHHGLAELDRVAVMAAYRKKGIGRQLFQGVVQDARKFYARQGEKLRKLYLMTHDDNKTAAAFYKKMGLKKEAVLPNHYYDGRGEAIFSIFFE